MIHRESTLKSNLKFFLAAILLTFPFYWYTAAPGITLVDSGEFVTVCARLGIGHPPGVPTYVMLGHLWSLLPIGASIARRLNLFSAVCAALTVGFSYLLSRELLPEVDRRLVFADALAFGFSMSLWNWAVVTEVYALNILLITVMFWLALRGSLVWAAFVAGVALGVHHATVAMAIPAACMLSWESDKKITVRYAGAIAAAGAFGLSVYLYLSIRGAQHPVFNWGEIETWRGFYDHVTGSYYRSAVGMESHGGWAGLAHHLRLFGRHFIQQLSPVATAIVLLGWISTFRKDRFLFWFSTVIVGLNLGFIAITDMGGVDVSGYYLPCFLTMVWMFPFGARAIGSYLYLEGRPGFAVFVLAVAIAAAPFNFRLNNHHEDRVGELFVENSFRDVPDGSLILTSDWNFYAPWLAMRNVQGFRPNVDVLFTGLLSQEWYLASLKRDYPEMYRVAGGERDVTIRQFIDNAIASRLGHGRVFYTMKIEQHYLPSTPVFPHGLLYEYMWPNDGSIRLDLTGLRGEVPADDTLDLIRRNYASMITESGNQMLGQGEARSKRFFLDATSLVPSFPPAIQGLIAWDQMKRAGVLQ